MAKIAVVGGGLAGCAAAVRLAHAGHEVTLFEKNAHLGGKMNVWEEGGYYFDMGPTIITKPDVLDRLFSDVGAGARIISIWCRSIRSGARFSPTAAGSTCTLSLQEMTAELQPLRARRNCQLPAISRLQPEDERHLGPLVLLEVVWRHHGHDAGQPDEHAVAGHCR